MRISFASAIGAGLMLLALLFAAWPQPSFAATCRTVSASWYGAESGNRTASGMRFDGSQFIVAHKSLAFGTRLRLTYHGRSVVAEVQDRGPFVAGREIDLSHAVAKALGTTHAGVVRLCMEIL